MTVPWTVFQYAPEDSILMLFNKIKSGAVPVISPASVSEPSESQLECVYVGSSRDALSIVDYHLLVSNVSKVIGHFVKYNVVLQLNTSEPVAQSLPNAFLVLITGSEQQASAERKPLPDIVPEKTSKEKLYNAIIAWLEKNGCS